MNCGVTSVYVLNDRAQMGSDTPVNLWHDAPVNVWGNTLVIEWSATPACVECYICEYVE